MLGLFKPRCPIDVHEKVWTELRMNWLVRQFGLERLRRATIVLPTREYFPEPYAGTREDARTVFHRVCRYLDVDARTIELEFYGEEEAPGAAGLYDTGQGGARPVVAMSDAQLPDQESLIATFAHEVAHHLLLGDGLLTGEEHDHEQVTDLLTAFLGMGIFAANTVVKQRSELWLNWESWHIRKQGYLPARIYGYVFALTTWARGESRTAWRRYLGYDAASALRSGLKYLKRTGDTLFAPFEGTTTWESRSTATLVSDLSSDSESVRLASLWEIQRRGGASADIVDALLDRLRHDTPILRAEAAVALGGLGEPAAAAVADLMELTRSQRAICRKQAARALGQIRPDLQWRGPHGSTVREELLILLDDANGTVVNAAAGAFAQYGMACSDAADRLAPHLETALVECDYAKIDFYLQVLDMLVPDVEGYVRDRLSGRTPELYELARVSLKQAEANASDSSAEMKPHQEAQ